MNAIGDGWFRRNSIWPLAVLFVTAMSLGLLCVAAETPLKLAPHPIHLRGKNPFSLSLPAELEIAPAAEGLKRVRFMARSPDGRIFVTAMHDLSDNSKGAVYILEGLDEKSGRFARVIPYLTHLRNPNSIAFYTDPHGQNWFYLALTDRLVRYKFTRGEKSPSSTAEVLAKYPDYGLSYKYGGWHLTRTIAFGPDGRLYVTVGSSCNACGEKEEIRATLSVMDADGKNQHIIAKGLRNAVGMRFAGGKLFLTNMGADHLGNDEPDDVMFTLDVSALQADRTLGYGWPRCYYSGGKARADVSFSLPATVGASGKSCSAADAFAFFKAHSSPLGLDYFGRDSTEPNLRSHFLVALHGASNKKLGRGYRVVQVNDHGEVRDFITGFMAHGVVRGRPCDIFKLSENSFLMSDDAAGVIYYVRPK